MIENHRRFVACVMCGSTNPLTAEHLFGKALARRIGERRPWSANVNGTLETVQGGNPLLFTTYKCLCSECNTNRFSTMMSDATPLLFGLARGHTSELSATDQSVLLRYFERLALLIDVVTSNQDITDEVRATPEFQRNAAFRRQAPAYSAKERRAWLLQRSNSPKPSVFIGRHMGILGLELKCSVDHASFGTFASLKRAGRFHLVLGQLAIDLHWPIVFPEGKPGAVYHHLTHSKTPIVWPPIQDVSYLDFYLTHAMSQHVVEEMVLYTDPDWIGGYEEKVRASAQPQF